MNIKSIKHTITLNSFKRKTASTIIIKSRNNFKLPQAPKAIQIGFDEDNNSSTHSGGCDATISELDTIATINVPCKDKKNNPVGFFTKTFLPIKANPELTLKKRGHQTPQKCQQTANSMMFCDKESDESEAFVFGYDTKSDKKYLSQFKKYLKSKNKDKMVVV